MSSSSPSLWQNPSMVPSPVPEEGLGGMQGVVHMSTNLVRGRRALRGRDVFRFRSEIANTGNRYRQLPKTKHQEVCRINPRSPISHQYTVSCHSTLDASIPRIFNLQPGAQRHPSPSTASTPGHTLRGAGVKWRTTRSRAGPSRQAALRLSGVQRQTASACLAFPCFVQAICRRQHAAVRRQHTVSWRLSSSTLTRQFLPYLFFSPSSRHHITVTPSPHPPSPPPSPPPSSPPLGSSDPSSLFFFPCSMKVETALHEFPVHPAASRGRCHRLYLSPLSRAAAPAEKDFDADEERTDVLTLSGLVRPQRPAVETGTRTKES